MGLFGLACSKTFSDSLAASTEGEGRPGGGMQYRRAYKNACRSTSKAEHG
jgi:hypothetical protein